MCHIEAYGKLHQASAGSESSGGDRPLPDRSTTDALV